MQGPLFESAWSAAMFAINYHLHNQPEKSAMLKAMSDPSPAGGKGLVGLDGAAQSGMVLSELKRVGTLGEACIIARIAKKQIPCYCKSDCCNGHRPNWTWMSAIGTISTEVSAIFRAEREPGKRGEQENHTLQRLLIAKVFGTPVKLSEAATEHDITPATVGNHYAKILRLLKRAEADAWRDFEAVLKASGII